MAASELVLIIVQPNMKFEFTLSATLNIAVSALILNEK